MIAVRTFSSATEMMAFYKDLNARLKPPPQKAAPKPVAIALPDEPPPPVVVSPVHTVFRPEPGPVGAKKIVAFIAAKHELSARDIIGRGRCQKIRDARFEAYALVFQMNPSWSLIKLGMFFHRDHTSLLSALRKMGLIARPVREAA